MLIENKPNSEQFKGPSHKENQIRWIAGLDYRKATLAIDFQQQAELVEKRRGIFNEKCAAPFRFEREMVSVNGYSINTFE